MKKNGKKIDTKKTIASITFMILVIVSSSYLFQSCDGSIIDTSGEDSLDQLIDDLYEDDNEEEKDEDEEANQDSSTNNEDSNDAEIEYFILDILDTISEEYPSIVIDNNNETTVPNYFEIIEFNQDRMFGWVNLSGFENNVDNGFYYFEINENNCYISNDNLTFEANIDFDRCWQVDSFVYVDFNIGDDSYHCYFE